VALKLVDVMFSKLVSWMVLRRRSHTSKEIEILVLHHQLAVLSRSSSCATNSPCCDGGRRGRR
jgi:hypothetical protein